MTSDKQHAYDRYQNADTQGSLVALPAVQGMHPDFAEYMNTFSNLGLDSVDLTPIKTFPWSKQVFYQTLLSQTFHVYYPKPGDLDPRYFPQAFGPSVAMVEFRRRENGDYVVTHRDLTNPHETYTIENPSYYVLSSRSLEVKEGLAQMSVKMLSKMVNGTNIWNYQLVRGNNLFLNLYLVDFNVREN